MTLVTSSRPAEMEVSGRTPPALAVEGVSKVFRGADGRTLPALAEVSFSVAPGELVSVVGPSGCGKSTLLRLMADLLPPSSGELRLNGKSPHAARLDRDFSLVFQRPVLFEWRTVFQNVKLPLEVRGVPRSQHARRVAELLDLVQLGHAAGLRPWQLSGGMQQRVALARALATNPSLLLLDEPFGALDEMAREALQLQLLGVCEATHVTTLLVTHSIAEAVFLSDRVLVMSPAPGRILFDVPIDLPRPRSAAVRESPAFFRAMTRVRQRLYGEPLSDE